MPEPLPQRDDSPPDPRAQLREPGIECRLLDNGGLHIHLAAARRKPVAPAVIGVILSVVAIGFFLAPVPGVMRIATFAFGCIFIFLGGVFGYIAIYLWLVSQDLTIRLGSLVLERRALFIHSVRTFNVSEIAEITCRQDGESSTGNGSNVVIFHGIQLKARNGKSTWLASNISQSDYAAWLTDKINDALGRSHD